MRNKEHVFLCPNISGQQKYPVKNVSGNIGYIKYVSFLKKRGCLNIYGVQIFRVNTVFKFEIQLK